MKQLYDLVEGYWKRFPEGIEPYQMVTRLLEECGEVASEVNHFEGSGLKNQKHGQPSKQALAGEIKNALTALIQLAKYYEVENELNQSIQDSLQRMKDEKLL